MSFNTRVNSGFPDARVCNFSEGIKKTTKYHLSDVDKFVAINKKGFKEKKPFIFGYFPILRATKEPVSIKSNFEV